MAELIVIGAFCIIALATLNLVSLFLSFFGGDKLAEKRKRGGQ